MNMEGGTRSVPGHGWVCHLESDSSYFISNQLKQDDSFMKKKECLKTLADSTREYGGIHAQQRDNVSNTEFQSSNFQNMKLVRRSAIFGVIELPLFDGSCGVKEWIALSSQCFQYYSNVPEERKAYIASKGFKGAALEWLECYMKDRVYWLPWDQFCAAICLRFYSTPCIENIATCVVHEREWFIFGDHLQAIGPFTWFELQNLVINEEITEYTLAWCEGLKEWQPIYKIQGHVSSVNLNPFNSNSEVEEFCAYGDPNKETSSEAGAIELVCSSENEDKWGSRDNTLREENEQFPLFNVGEPVEDDEKLKLDKGMLIFSELQLDGSMEDLWNEADSNVLKEIMLVKDVDADKDTELLSMNVEQHGKRVNETELFGQTDEGWPATYENSVCVIGVGLLEVPDHGKHLHLGIFISLSQGSFMFCVQMIKQAVQWDFKRYRKRIIIFSLKSLIVLGEKDGFKELRSDVMKLASTNVPRVGAGKEFWQLARYYSLF